MGKKKEIRTSAQKSQEVLRRARIDPVQPVIEEKGFTQEIILEPEVIEPIRPRPTFKSSFPDVIPPSSRAILRMFEESIATGTEPIKNFEVLLDEPFRKDLEGVSLSMVRGFRRWKDYLHS